MQSSFHIKTHWLVQWLLAMLLYVPVAAQDGVADSADFRMDGYVLGPQENAEEKISQNLFLKTLTSRQSCFEGEAIEVEYLLYTRLSLDARVGRKTGFEGFASIEMPTVSANGRPFYRWHNGKVYKVYAIRKVQLTPLQSGTLKVGTLSLDATVTFLKKENGQTDDDIDPFLPGNRSIHNLTLESPAVFITAQPLPPANNVAFGGLVGQFKIEAKIDSAPAIAGRMSHLLITITGQGNWIKVQCPPIQWPQGFQAYEPSVTEQLDSQHVPVAGQQVYRIPFETKQSGTVTIPGISLFFFNPQTGAYETSVTAPISIAVAPASAAPTETVPVNSSGDFTFAFTRWAPWFFATAAVVLLIVLLRAAALNKAKARAHVPTENWDQPDAGIGNISRRLDASSGAFKSVDATWEPPKNQDEIHQLARQYYQSVNDLLQEQLAGTAHKNDPLYLQLVQHGVAETHCRSIMHFLDRCEALMHTPSPEEDAETLSTSFYETLRLIRHHV